MNKSEGSPMKERKKGAKNKYFFLSGVEAFCYPFNSQTNSVFTVHTYVCMLQMGE